MPTSRAERQAGFTLLELLAVLVILVLAASGVVSVAGKSLETARVRSFLVQSEALFRSARTMAIENRVETAVLIDASSRRLVFPAAGRSVEMPQGVSLDATVARPDGNGVPSVRFFPSGGSTGGELSFGFRGRNYALRINWLTGRANAETL